MVTHEELNAIFAEVGSKYRYEDVEVEFAEFRDLKVQWKRTPSWIAFRVSDYLTDAPRDAIEDLAKLFFERILDASEDYPSAFKKWVTRPEFCTDKRETYLDRCESFTKSTKGKYQDLGESLARLQATGLVPEMEDLYLTWSEDPAMNRPGNNSILMKTVSISTDFDSKDTPEWVLDWALYYELAPLVAGYDPRNNSDLIDEIRRKYPRYGEAMEYAREHILYNLR